MIKKLCIVLGVGAALACVLGLVAHSASRQAQTPSVEDLHFATTVERNAIDASQVALEVQLASQGMEPNRSGFHLLRPEDDPVWDVAHGPTLTSGGYYWTSRAVKYMSVTYQCRCPIQPVPSTWTNPGWCILSDSRVIGNNLGAASYSVEANGSYKVVVQFTQRGISSLKVLLQNTQVSGDGSYVDWFHVDRASGEAPTKMRVAVVANDTTYLPVDIQAMLADQGSTAIVATGLTQAEATQLAGWLNVP